MYVALPVVLACGHPRPPQVPGSTLRAVESVTIKTTDGGDPGFDVKVLLGKLAHRTGNFIIPPRDYNPLRMGEDRRRIATWASNFGFFDVEVSAPVVTDTNGKVAISWRVAPGEKYRIGELKLVGAPPETRAALLAKIPFRRGSEVTVNENRILRHKLADVVRWHGYAHARVHSRAWVDRAKKSVAWYYFVDPGPRTRIASIEVIGNHRLSSAAILRRSGLSVGAAYSPRERDRAQLALMDAASVSSVVIDGDEDIYRGPPQVPDLGGTPQTDARGELVPRQLATGLNVKIVVVEAPRRALRVEVGTEADPTRTDVFAGARVVFRDVATAALHLVFAGKLGYGYELGTSNEPLGTYGYAFAQLARAGAFAGHLDLRGTASLVHTLFPDSAVREYSAGPGLRRTLADRLFLDVELLAFGAAEVDPLAITAEQRDSVRLSQSTRSKGAKLIAALVHDARDSGIEATAGHLASAYVELAPDALGARHRWLRLSGDLRFFHPLSPRWSIATRGAASWVLAANEQGLPLQSRLFGGGAHGFRGHGRQALSPEIAGLAVGGTSMVEGSVELRNLPFQKFFGSIAFIDVGAVASEANPFAEGVSVALGIGGRARPSYIPIAVDLSYRAIDKSALASPITLSSWSVFLRLGEAF